MLRFIDFAWISMTEESQKTGGRRTDELRFIFHLHNFWFKAETSEQKVTEETWKQGSGLNTSDPMKDEVQRRDGHLLDSELIQFKFKQQHEAATGRKMINVHMFCRQYKRKTISKHLSF